MAISGFFIFKHLIEDKKQEEKFEKLIEMTENIEISNDNSEYKNEKELDLLSLYSANNDLVGWLKIKNTTINYPVMKSKEPNFYLRKDFYKNYSRWRNTIFIR